MRIILLANYYYPETIGAGIWIRQLAEDLAGAGHQVTVVTSMPSYPAGEIDAAYRGRWFARETVGGVQVIRTFTYATRAKSFWARFLSFGAFCVSSLVQGLAAVGRADVVYAILPPMPLGVPAWMLALRTSARLVTNVQDIYPDIAEATGFLTNRTALGFFRRMADFIYRRSKRVVVISEGFKDHLAQHYAVPRERLAVVPNWADPNEIQPLPRDNAFRQSLDAQGQFVVLYSGGLSINSYLDPLLEAAHELRNEPFRFVLVGDGPRRAHIEQQVRDGNLTNVTMLPFQPLERYAEVLAAADATTVTLSSAASFCSVPSKIFKQMAAARPVIAITSQENEVTRLVREADCGISVPTGRGIDVARALRWAYLNQTAFAAQGDNGRRYLERECSRARCVRLIEDVLRDAAGGRAPAEAARS